MTTADEVLALPSSACARLVRDCLGDAQLDAQLERVLADAACAEGAHDGDGGWRSAAAALWRDEGSRSACDVVPGLRTRIRLDGCGTLCDAITDLLAQRVAQRSGDAHLIGCDDGRLWIADACFGELRYHLELDRSGRGPGAADDPLVHACLPESPAQLWQRWLCWAADTAPQRGFVSHPRFLGSFPASGLPLDAPRVQRIIAACRRHPSIGPLLAVGQRPLLLPWLPRTLPALDAVLDAARAEGHAALRLPPTIAGMRQALERDPHLALQRALAHLGGTCAGAALATLLARVAVMLANTAAAPTAEAHGAVIAVCPERRPLHAPVRMARDGDRLLIDEDGLASLITWVGWFPLAYQPVAGAPSTWPWRVLAHCGWHAVARSGHWQAASDAGGTRWLRFAAGSAARWLPERAAAVEPPPPWAASCAMRIDAA